MEFRTKKCRPGGVSDKGVSARRLMHEECFKTRIVEIPRKAECFSTLCYFAACQMSLLCTWHLFTSCSGTVLTVGKLTQINGPFSDF